MTAREYELVDSKQDDARGVRNRKLLLGALLFSTILVFLLLWVNQSTENSSKEESSLLDVKEGEHGQDFLNKPQRSNETSDSIGDQDIKYKEETSSDKEGTVHDAMNHSTRLPKRESLWDLKLPRHRVNRHPNLSFVKGLKVGGTTIAYALNAVAQHYNIKLARVSQKDNAQFHYHTDCSSLKHGTLFFHHGFRNDWQQECLKNVRFATLLRDPVSQALSWESMSLNRGYFLKYPGKQCKTKRKQRVGKKFERDLLKKLHSTQHCVDTPFRKTSP